MNIDSLQSFLDVAETSSFSIAGMRSDLTQSTVSARIRSLEENLGVRLFHRSRSGVELTFEGQQFRPQAEQIVTIWKQAKRQVALPDGYEGVFRLGGAVSLNGWLSLSWTQWMKQHAPRVALHVEAGTSESLCEGLLSQSLDAAVVYLPPRRPELVVDELMREEIVLVQHSEIAGDWKDNYLSLDWGAEFNAMFRKEFPNANSPTMSVGPGVLGMQYVIALKASAYLPRTFIKNELETGLLKIVDEAPSIHRPIYLVYCNHVRDLELFAIGTRGLRAVTQN
jgi:DNA-binding transcriptional LysR family regulator